MKTVTPSKDERSRLKTIEQPDRMNAALYEAGKRYAKRLYQLRAGDQKKAAQNVAAEFKVPPDEVEDAIKFADAVDRIATNCRGEAKKFILSNHPRLPARVVMKISRTHAVRQRYALAQAKANCDPFRKPPPGIDPPFDTHNPAEVLNRLGRNAGALDAVADGLRDAPTNAWPTDRKIAAILDHAATVRRLVRRMKLLVQGGATPRHEKSEVPVCRTAPGDTNAFAPMTALRAVAAVAGVTRKNARDLPRVLADTPPTEAERVALLVRLNRLDASAGRLIEVIRTCGHDLRTGPSEVPGTYVVFYYLPKAAKGLKIGALGTFDFPAGYYAYLGSAFGGGGVRKRTHRHLTHRSMNKKWNVDHLKPLCTPVAVWWTHDRGKVEFDWAAILGSLPGAFFPAPKFGSADNPKAQAHLVHFADMPSFAAFQRRVQAAMKGHAQVHEKSVENWTGCGWPV